MNSTTVAWQADIPPPRADRQTLILDAIPSIIVLIDETGRVVEWNRAAQEVLGISTEQALGRSLAELSVDWPRDALLKGVAAAQAQNSPQRLDQLDYQLANGDKGILGFTLIPLSDGDGKPFGCILQGAEITDRKRLESQLAQAQKMESIGQLAAGIAHEINTPTQYIGDNVRFLQEAFDELAQVPKAYQNLIYELLQIDQNGDAGNGALRRDELEAKIGALNDELDLDYLAEEVPQALTQSLEGIAQVSRIVKAMKQFSHPDSQGREASNINAALENTVTVARNEWKYVAEVELELDPQLPPVPCYLGELNQVFLNIVVNAAHAIEEKLASAASAAASDAGADIGKGVIKVSTQSIDDAVEIRIGDSGNGIPEQAQPRIFDLFFTTKEVGKGTGQGLALAYSVVAEKHGGEISFETEPGFGTTFIIRLPLA